MNHRAGFTQVMKLAGLGSAAAGVVGGGLLGAGVGYGVNAIPHMFDWRRDHIPFWGEPYYRPQRFYERWGLGYDEGKKERRGALLGAAGGALAGGLALGLPPRFGILGDVAGEVVDHMI